MKKEIPILFSKPMVQAILEGRKTQTRRIIKSRHESGLFQICRRVTDGQITDINSLDWGERNCERDITPKWTEGDILWVREKFKIISYDESSGPQGQSINGRYEDGTLIPNIKLNDDEWEKYCHWKNPTGEKPSLFLFKSLSRIRLEVENVRVERLHDISEADAKAEGVNYTGNGELGNPIVYEDYLATGAKFKHSTNGNRFTAKDSFKSLWQSINGEESWEANSWVWVVEFKRIDGPQIK